MDLVIRKTADKLGVSGDPKARPNYRPCVGDGYAHELASKIADQKKNKNKSRERVRRKPSKRINYGPV
jgi:hypothetical protein